MCFQCFPLSFSPRRAFVLGSCCLRQRESADLSRASPLLACSRHPWGRVQGRRWGGGASDVSCFHQNIQCRDNALVDRKGSCPLKEGFLFLKGRERFTYTHNTRLHTTECGQVDFLQMVAGTQIGVPICTMADPTWNFASEKSAGKGEKQSVCKFAALGAYYSSATQSHRAGKSISRFIGV